MSPQHPVRWWRAPIVVALALGVVATACGGSDTATPATPVVGDIGDPVAEGHPLAVATSGEYVADLGFRPEPDGFGFPNYGNPPGIVNLTPPEMVELFGDEVCAFGAGPTCRLSSAAVIWLEQVNGIMGGGHCDGLAAMSLRFFEGSDDPERYGAPTTFDLELEGNEELQRAVARWFATQVVSPATDQRISDATPAEVVSVLSESMAADPDERELYSLLFFQPGLTAGHAVTPYAIEDRGDGVSWILVYDNNHPGIPRAIEVDTRADTWEYLGSSAPGDEATTYRGDASTGTLWLSPSSGRLGVQQCPVCQGEFDELVSGRGADELKLSGQGAEWADTDFFVRGPTGRTFGRVDGAHVDEIDGAEVVPVVAGARGAPAPVLRVPHAFDLEAVAAGPRGVTTDLSMSYLGAQYDVLISGIDTATGPAIGGFDVDAERVTFRSGDATGATVLVALEGDEFHYELEVTIEQIDDPAATVELVSPGDDARVGLSAGSGASYSITLTRFGEDVADDRRTVDGVRLDDGQELLISLDDWVGPESLELEVVELTGAVDDPPLRTISVG